jgi:hypothetical protein
LESVIDFKDIKKGDRLKIGIQGLTGLTSFYRYATAFQDTLVTGRYAENPASQYVNVRFDDPKRPYNDAPYKDSPHPNDSLYGPYHSTLSHRIDERSAEFRGRERSQSWTIIYKITEETVTTQIEQAQADIKAAENLLRNAQDNLAKATAPKVSKRQEFVDKLNVIPTGSLITFGSTVVLMKAYGATNTWIKDTGRTRTAAELFDDGYSHRNLKVLYENK